MFSMAYGYEIQPKFRQKKNPDAIKHRGILVGVGGIMRLYAV